MAIVMGVDLSLTATGLVVLGTGGAINQATVFSPKQRGDDRLYAIAAHVCEAISHWQPACVCVEAPAYSSFNTVILGEMHGAVRSERARRLLPRPYYVSPMTLKKYATGAGKGDKSNVKMCVLEKWDQKFTDDNLCDGYVLARMAGGLHGSLQANHKYEIECLKAVSSGVLNQGMPNAKHF